MRFLNKFPDPVGSRSSTFASKELPVNKPRPRITLRAFLAESSELSFAAPKKPLEPPSQDQEARELTQFLNDVAAKHTSPPQPPQSERHEQLLERVQNS